jgi:hypothetical protein
MNADGERWMIRVKNVFVVLTYRNTDDIKDFIVSVNENVDEYRIIIVNSYFDDDSMQKFEKIALENDCDFINIPNKGYSYGNNRGIDYARNHYDFEYLIISNPDIIVKKFSTEMLGFEGIYCGKIITLNGKNQNPMLAKECKLADKCLYIGYKNNLRLLFILGLLMNKLLRTFFRVHSCKGPKRVFQPHGSFIVFSIKSIDILKEVFDENIFLFGEEGILAKRCKRLEIPVYYNLGLECIHKEDGSMKLFKGDLGQEYKNSVIYYYENYCNNDNRKG